MPTFLTVANYVVNRTHACRMAGLLIANVMIMSSASAQEANSRYLTELRKIQADYCQSLWYPTTQRRPGETGRWDQNDAKQQRIAKLDTRGVDAGLLVLTREAKALSDEVSKVNRDYVKKVEDEGRELVDNLPNLLLDPPEGPDWFKDLLPSLIAESKLDELRRRCKTEEPDFTRRWRVKLAALATNLPALKPFADDPESCSPLSAFSVPIVKWTDQEIGTSHTNPYRLGDLNEPIEFEVEPRPSGSWLYYYRFYLPKVVGPSEFVNLQVTSSTGYVHACFNKVVKQKLGTSNERANASAGKTDQIQYPLEPGEEYLLSVYHIHKPDFGPQWSDTKAIIRLWRGDGTKLPMKLASRVINLEQQKKWLEQQRLSQAAARQRLQKNMLATFASRPEFEGRYAEAGAVHPFKFRVLQFVPGSKAVAGEIEWPTYRGTTRFRGQLVSTNEGEELSFKETDFVPGKASSKLLLGGEYRLKPEARDDKLFMRGELRLQNRVHPLIMQATMIESSSVASVDPPILMKNEKTPTVVGKTPDTSPPKGGKPETPPAPSVKPDDAATVATIAQNVVRPASGLTEKAGELHVFTGVTSYDGPLGVIFSKDGKNALATGDRLRAWDLVRGLQTLDHDQNSYHVALLPNGSKAIFTGYYGSASHALYQMALKKGGLPTHMGELERTTSLAVSRDSKWAAVSRNPGVLVTFDLVKNRKGLELPVNQDVTALAFGETSSTLVTGDDQNGVRVWDLRDGGQLKGRFAGHGKNAAIRMIALSDDGKTVASLSAADNAPDHQGPLTLIFWDRQSLEEKHSVSLGQAGVSSCLSPDWKYALVGEQSGEVGVYSVATGECLETLSGHTEKVTSLAFSPCWRFALTASSDDTVRLWGLEKTK